MNILIKLSRAFWTTLCLLTLFSSCDNDTNDEDFDVTKEKLSQEVEQDLKMRFEGAEIQSFYNWTANTPGTEVNLEDIDGNKVSIFYQDYKRPSLTVTHFSSFYKLPENIQKAFMASHHKNFDKNLIENIECDDYAILGKKMYKLEFHHTIGKWENRYTMVMFNEDGFMFPDYNLGEGLINPSWNFKEINMSDIHFIKQKYGNDIRSFNHDCGYSSYYVMDKGVLKYVRFRDDEWKGTRYLLPEGMEVPEKIMKELRSSAPDLEYTEIYVVETPLGGGYKFCDEVGNSCTLGDMFVKREI